MNRIPLPDMLTGTGIVAVLRAPHASCYLPVVQTLAAAGVVSIELTLTTPGTTDLLPEIVASAPEAEIGVGTVLTAGDAQACLDAGAQFIVTPAVIPEVIQLAVQRAVPVLPGAMTPTEVHRAWSMGASAVKIFPASTLGPKYVEHLRGPFPDLKVVPSGGIALPDVEEWLLVGSSAVSLGGPLIGGAFRDGDLAALKARARRALLEVSRGAA